MGFFSKTCAKTHLPVLAGTSWPSEYCDVVVLLPNGARITGVYDGCGRVDGHDIMDCWDDAKFVLRRFYKDETYSQLGDSHNKPGQGHFHSPEFIAACYARGGFPSIQAYRDALHDFSSSGVACHVGLRVGDVECDVRIEKQDAVVYANGRWEAGYVPDELFDVSAAAKAFGVTPSAVKCPCSRDRSRL